MQPRKSLNSLTINFLLHVRSRQHLPPRAIVALRGARRSVAFANDNFYSIEYMRKRGYLSQLELMVLLAVVCPSSQSAYGVSIARDIAKSNGRRVALASVYAALERLEHRGFVSSKLGEPRVERGGRARTYFRATAAGMKEARNTYDMLVRLGRDLPELKEQPA